MVSLFKFLNNQQKKCQTEKLKLWSWSFLHLLLIVHFYNKMCTFVFTRFFGYLKFASTLITIRIVLSSATSAALSFPPTTWASTATSIASDRSDLELRSGEYLSPGIMPLPGDVEKPPDDDRCPENSLPFDYFKFPLPNCSSDLDCQAFDFKSYCHTRSHVCCILRGMCF